MQNTFSFTLRVDIPLPSTVNAAALNANQLEVVNKIADKLCNETHEEKGVKDLAKKKINKLKQKESTLGAIKFILNTNPDDNLYEAEDRVFLDELILGSFKYVETYIEHIKKELSNLKALKKGLQRDDYRAKLDLAGAKPLTIGEEKYSVYPMSHRNISKIVYRKNSPVLANVHFQASLNGDLQPPGSGRPS
jgi:hypothetical protein